MLLLAWGGRLDLGNGRRILEEKVPRSGLYFNDDMQVKPEPSPWLPIMLTRPLSMPTPISARSGAAVVILWLRDSGYWQCRSEFRARGCWEARALQRRRRPGHFWFCVDIKGPSGSIPWVMAAPAPSRSPYCSFMPPEREKVQSWNHDCPKAEK